jgi:deoxyribodipyrimidine photo-lyase
MTMQPYSCPKNANIPFSFIHFDRNILDKLENKADRRVEFIHAALIQMQEKLIRIGTLEVHCGKPEEIFKRIITSV